MVGARVHLLHAVEPVGPADRIEIGASDSPLAILDRNEALTELKAEEEQPAPGDDSVSAVLQACHTAQVSCSFKRVHGMARRVLREQSRAMDMLVLGRHGERGRRPLGATASAILTRPAAPTLLCLEEVTRFERVLLAYEPTPSGGRALRLAGELCEDLNIELDVLVADHRREWLDRNLDYAKGLLRSYHVEGEHIKHHGPAAGALATYALELQSSLLVVPQERPCLLLSTIRPLARAAVTFPTAMAMVVP